MWNLNELKEFCSDEENLFNFLKIKGLIPQSMNCPDCGWEMKMFLKGQYWKCHKTLKTKKGKKICGKKVSINKNSWFSKTKLSHKQVLLLTYMLVYNYNQEDIARELKINKSTISQWNIFVKQVMIEWLTNNSKPIGGENKIVEIDESKFGKRKYNRGRVLEGQWVFGGICRETKEMFLVPVEDRTSTTLITIIKQWVLPGSKIISNCWRAYKMLNQQGYEHLTVNHSISFIDSNTGAHTNTIECMWRHANEFLPAYNRKKDKFIQYLAHFLFKNEAKKKHKDLFECILSEISQIKFEEGMNLDEEIELKNDEEER